MVDHTYRRWDVCCNINLYNLSAVSESSCAPQLFDRDAPARTFASIQDVVHLTDDDDDDPTTISQLMAALDKSA